MVEQVSLLERFEKHTESKIFAKRVYNLVKDCDFVHLTLEQLLSINGMGRAAALLVMDVAADLMKKK